MSEISEQTLGLIWRLFPHCLATYLSLGKWVPFPYLVVISEYLAEAIAEGNRRIIINLPPRHGKSELVSKWFTIWFLENFPDKQVILSSYSSDFASRWGRIVRNTIMEQQDKLNVRISDDSNSASRWHTTAGGSMTCLGVDASITGRGGDLIIVDDPVKNIQEAQSEVQRNHLVDWFKSTLLTRAEPGATIIVIMTRWHEYDLTGHLLSEPDHDWELIRLPALAEEVDPIGRRPGEPLCPERFDERALLSTMRNQGASLFSAMYQQTPVPPSGNTFKRDWWNFYASNELPDLKAVCQSWDCAFGEGRDSSYSVGQTWGVTDQGYYLINQLREKLDFPSLVRKVKMKALHYDPNIILIEKQASGRSLAQTLLRETRFPIKLINVSNQTKEQRAEQVTSIVEARRVWLPKDEVWTSDLLQELSMFPYSRHTDQVDALTQALRHMEYSMPQTRQRPSARQRPRGSSRPWRNQGNQGPIEFYAYDSRNVVETFPVSTFRGVFFH